MRIVHRIAKNRPVGSVPVRTWFSTGPALFFAASVLLFVGHVARADDLTAPNIVINELMWMGSSTSSADEWIELRNMTNESIDLTNWRITKLSGGAEVTMVTLPAGKTIPAQGYFLLSNYAATSPSSALTTTPDVVTTDVALSNSALQVRLYDAVGLLHDVADDGVGNPLSGQLNTSEKIWRSMERNPGPTDGTTEEAWHTATLGLGFKTGLLEFGTPGTENSNGAPRAVAGENQTGVIGQVINFDGSESRDPENQTLAFAWDFGDGTISAESAPEHIYLAAGEYVVTLTVSDGQISAEDKISINISAPASLPTPLPKPSTGMTTVSPGITSSCQGIQLTEIFPNPAGRDDGEFFELLNPTKKPIELQGCTWWLNDKRKAVLHNVTLGPGKRCIIEKAQSKLSLTNAGGTLKLIDVDGTTLVSVTYPKAPDGESWSIFGTEWSWTNRVTPGKKNLRPIDDELETSSTKKDDEQPESVGLDDIQTLDSGTLVVIRGVVTVAPNLLGTRVIFLQSESGAVSVVLPEKAIAVSVGDEVEFAGKVRMSQGRKRVVGNVDGVHILAHGQTVQPQTISLDQLAPELADHIVNVSGLISNSSGAKWLIDDGTAEAEIYVKTSTGIIKPRSASGDRLVATGIVSVTTAGIRVLPRAIDDLRVERVLGAATEKMPTKITLPTSSPQQSMWYWVLVVAGGLVVAARPIWKFFQTRKNPASGGRIEV